MKTTIPEAAGGEATGSAYHVQKKQKQAGALVDCKRFQGGGEAEELNRPPAGAHRRPGSACFARRTILHEKAVPPIIPPFPWFSSAGNWLHGACAASLALLISILVGCAAKETSTSAPQQQNGIQEYQRNTLDAIGAMNTALKSLNLVAVQTNPCPDKIVDAFADEVQRLQVESIRIRSHAQAIQARGDAYFDNWSENLARVKDPQVRELAEHFHPQLQQSFNKVKATSQQTGAAFRNFFSGLRKLRNSLQNNPAGLESQSVQDLIRTTRTNGQQVLQSLGSLEAELNSMKSMITPRKATAGNYL